MVEFSGGVGILRFPYSAQDLNMAFRIRYCHFTRGTLITSKCNRHNLDTAKMYYPVPTPPVHLSTPGNGINKTTLLGWPEKIAF